MQKSLLLIFIIVHMSCKAQQKGLESISFSYFGEMITHPGFKIGLDYNLKEWNKIKASKKKSSGKILKMIMISPNIGSFYHRRYQTGVFFIPELKYKRQNPKRIFFEFGIGTGYLRTFIPNTYKVMSNGEVSKVIAGHNYFSTNYFLSFGRNLNIKNKIPISYFFKPQFMYTIPNFPRGVGYFILEFGLNFKLNKS